MFGLRLAVVTAALAMGSAAPAFALINVATFKGHVEAESDAPIPVFGYDWDGVFGPANSSLDGLAFTAVFTWDDTLGKLNLNSAGIGSEGGTGSGFASPILSAKLTINGVTQAFDAADHGFWQQSPTALQLTTSTYNSELTAYGVWDVPTLYANNFTTPTIGHGWFSMNKPDPRGAGSLPRVTGLLYTDTISYYSSGSAVPEPATWAMMIAGFGLAGANLRRSRRRVA